MAFNLKRSFTLVEMLIVVAIIGLLSSIIFVVLSSAKQKGRIAAAQQFASGLDSGVGAYAVAKYSFDEGAGTSVADSSGNGNNGTIHGAVWRCGTGFTPSDKGCSLEFDGNGAYVDAPNSTSLSLFGKTATLAAWIYTKGDVSHYQGILLKYAAANQDSYQMLLEDNTLKLGYYSKDSGYQYSDTAVLPNQWNHVAIALDGTKCNYYINGVNAGTDSCVISADVNDLFFVGRGGLAAHNYSFYGYIDDPRVFENALTKGEIQKLYAEGVEKHLSKTDGEL